ncbi:hypothetical protein F5Y16DRAFT_370152 [Xylariaceae sp. FL0255]|nr:hypothetical protein F5Y16DRAFT_370152 [Xylariaceae sp. FL0255]
MRSFILPVIPYLIGAACALVTPESIHFERSSPLNVTIVSNHDAIQKREPGGVFICTDINWGGTCGFAKQPWNECIQLTSPWYHSISSIGPDTFNAIVAFQDFSCSSDAKLAIFNPGDSDLDNQGWNDLIGSFVVLQLSEAACMEQNDFDQPLLAESTNCQSCCNGCDLSGTGCCPDGVIC